MKKFLEDFKAFIAKGSVIDMAVAVVIGGAFSKIVSSLVNDIIMPLISLIVDGLNVSDWKFIIRAAEYNVDGTLMKAETAFCYGNFLQTVIDFLIISLCIFIALRIILNLKDKFVKTTDEKAEEEPKETIEDILKDIRTSLNEQSKN